MEDVTRFVLKATDDTRAGFESAKRNFDQLKGSAAQVSGILGGIGAALGIGLTVAAFENMVRGVTELEDSLYKMSQRTGVAVEQLSTLRYAADLSGIKLEDLDGLLTKLNKTLGQAGAGDEKTAKFLSQFGINAAEVARGALTTDEALKRIADRFAAAPDGINKATAAVELFGKSGAGMIAFLNQGRQGIEDLQTEAKKLGLEISENTAKQAEAMNDQLRTLGFASEGAKIALVNELMPSLVAVTRAMRDATVEGGKFAGIWAGIKTALFGGPQYRNDVELIRLTEKKLELENQLDEVRLRRTPTEQASYVQIKSQLDVIDAQLKATMAYRGELEKVSRAEEVAAKIRDENRKKGAQIQPKLSPDTDKTVDQLKSIQTFADSIKERLTGQLSGEFEQLREKAADVFNKVDVSKLNPDQAQKFANALKNVNTNIAELERLQARRTQEKSDAEAMAERAAATDRAATAVREFIVAQATLVKDTEFELEMVGQLAHERERLVAIRRLDRDERVALAAVPEEAADRVEQLRAISAAAQVARDRTATLYDAIRTKSRDTFTGLNQAAAEYFERITNGAENSKQAFNATVQSMEDVFIRFVKTGKVDFKSLIDTMITEGARLQFRQAAANSLGNGGLMSGLLGKLGDLFNFGGASASAMDSVQFGTPYFPGYATGTDFVPRTGLALIHEGEKIIPAVNNRGGNDAGLVVQQTLNIGQGVSMGMIPQILDAARQGAIAAVAEQQRRGGR